MATKPQPSSPVATTRSGASYARFVGRLGALAVALGVGAVLAGSPGVAFADDGPSTSQSPADDSGSGSGHTTPKDADDESPSAKSDEPGPQRSSKKQRSRTARDDDGTRGALSVPGDEPDAKSLTRHLLDALPPPAREPVDREPVDDPARAARTRSDAPAAQVRSLPDVRTAAAPEPKVNEVVTRALSVLDLDPEATNGPAAPAQLPALWAMVGFVRRELGDGVARLTAGTPLASFAAAAAVDPDPSLGVSPLGTPEQISAEDQALETLNTLPMFLMRQVLKVGWRISANQQFDQVGGPDAENLAQLDQAVLEYAMGAAFQQQILNSNDPTAVMQVAPPHSWYGLDVTGSRILYDNPDTIYRFMGVNAASSYTITGQLPDNAPPAETSFSVLTGLSGSTASVLTGDQIVLGPDRTFVITVDGNDTGQPNHLYLPNEATLIAVRNTFPDWTADDQMSLAVIRTAGPRNSLFSELGGFAIPGLGPLVVGSPFLTTLVSLVPPLPMPPVLRGTIAAAVMTLGLVREPEYIGVATTDSQTGERRAPNVMSAPAHNASFLATQMQSAGYFQLADDEVLVLTIDPGDAPYFVVPVTNDWTITNNYWDQQTTLNVSQAKPNTAPGTEGTYTVVVSPVESHCVADQCVANWVYTGGLNQGTISMRFQGLPADPTNPPTVQSQVVKLEDLPEDLVYITTAERAQALADRKLGFDRRFAPYPQP